MGTRVHPKRCTNPAIFVGKCIISVLLFASCGGGGGSVTPPPVSAANVTISGAPITFDSQPIGTASPPRTVTLTNSGTATLNIASVMVAGPHAADFVLTNTCGSLLAPGASCTATVTFKPSAAGNRTASVNITDDAAGSPHIIPVSGTGIASAFTLSAASLDFGSQLVGAPSAAQTETVTNNGAANLTVSTVTIGGANPSDFAISKDTCGGATVAPSGACVVGVTFTPAVTGTRSATLTFADNAPGSPQSVSLGGVGNNSAPTLSSFSPASSTVGAGALTLTLQGSNFLSTSTVTYNGAAHPATYVSASALTITLSAVDQVTAGSYAVVVTNPAPGGGKSTLNFLVNNPAPTLSSFSPASSTVGAGALTLTLQGSNFQSASTVTYNGAAHPATYVSASALTITLSAADQATAGSYAVVVTNPAPGGGSSTLSFPVNTAAAGDHQRDHGERDGGQRLLLSDHGDEYADQLRRHGIAGGVNGQQRDRTDFRDAHGGGNLHGDAERHEQPGTGTASLTLTITGGGTQSPVAHTIQISSDADDGYFQDGSVWYSTPSSGGADLVGSWAGTTTAYVTGYRFPSTGVNSGDTIRSAYLQLVSSDGSASSVVCGSAPCPGTNSTFRVYGVAQDDGPSFSGSTGNTPLDVPYTTAYTDYTTTGPGDVHGSCQGNNNGQNTCTHIIDVTSIVNEITARPGWTSTSAIRFVLLSTDNAAPNVYAGFEDYSANHSKAATLVVNPPVPTMVSSGAWGTASQVTYPTTYDTGPFVYPGASTLLLFLGDYYNFYSQPIAQPTVSDSCGNTWNILAGPTNWVGYFYDMRSTVYYVQNPVSCPAGDTITITVDNQEPIFVHFLAVAGSNTAQAPIASAITSPSPGTYTTSATSSPITLPKAGLLVSWIFGDSDAPHTFTPQTGFITDPNSTPNYLTTVFESVSSPGSYQSQFSITPTSDGWQVVIIGLPAP